MVELLLSRVWRFLYMDITYIIIYGHQKWKKHLLLKKRHSQYWIEASTNSKVGS